MRGPWHPGTEDTQCIIGDDTKVPLIMNGPLMELPVCRPTLDKMTNNDIQIITLTLHHRWDPYGDGSITSYNLSSLMRVMPWGNPTITSIMSLNANMLGTTTDKRSITVSNLVSRWAIGKETTKSTLQSTWQE